MLRFILIFFPLILTSCGLIQTPNRETPHPPFPIPAASSSQTPLLVFTHGYHTGFTLPASAIRSEIPQLANSSPGKWLEFGWGDEGFYRAKKISLPLAFRALAYPTPSVMHVHVTNQPLHATYAFMPARLYLLNEKQRATLANYLSQQFQRDQQGRLIDLGPGHYGLSRFYQANDSFSYFRNCNSWTAKGLRTIGHEVHAITAPGIWRQIRPTSPESGIK